jgi:hypothetical protein
MNPVLFRRWRRRRLATTNTVDLNCDTLTAHAPVVAVVEHHLFLRPMTNYNAICCSSPLLRWLALALLLLLKRLLGGLNRPRPGPVRQIKSSAPLLWRGTTPAIRLLLSLHRSGFLFPIYRRRMGAMTLGRRTGQRVKPPATAAAASHPLVLNVELFGELAKNVVYLIGDGGGGRPPGLLNYCRPNFGLSSVLLILVIGNVAEVGPAAPLTAPPVAGSGL